MIRLTMQRRAVQFSLRLATRLVLLGTTACTTWRPVPPLQRASDADTLARTRITLRDGSRIELRDAVVRSDSILGESSNRSARIALARAQVTGVEARAFSTVRTVSLVVGVAAAVTVYAIGKATSALSSDIH